MKIVDGLTKTYIIIIIIEDMIGAFWQLEHNNVSILCLEYTRWLSEQITVHEPSKNFPRMVFSMLLTKYIYMMVIVDVTYIVRTIAIVTTLDN